MWPPRKKDVKFKVGQPRGCDGRLIAKNFNNVNLVLNPSEHGEGYTNLPELPLLKFLLLTYIPSQPFLRSHFGFHNFFHNSFLGGRTLFLQLGFGLDEYCSVSLIFTHAQMKIPWQVRTALDML